MSAAGAGDGSSGQAAPTRPAAPDSSAGPRPHTPKFWAGLVLMITSFALYPAYVLVALLPISGRSKATIALAFWVLSWAGFSLGSTMAGPEGIQYLRRLWRRRGGAG